MRVSLLAASTLATVSSASSLQINGWYPCGPTTTPRPGVGAGEVPEYNFKVGDKVAFECAQVAMPLCHDGLCNSEDGEKVQVFVKRIAAVGGASPVQQTSKRAKSLWLLAGGPGSSSVAMEPRMYAAYKDHNATVSVYTLDHRGTGRSNFLQCEAVQVNTDGSDQSIVITDQEMALCLQDLNFRYKNKAAAFSISSAAMDVKKIIEGLQPNEDVYVSGYSYGTSLLQRLVQLKPAPVRGFIFEGASVISAPKRNTQGAWSRWDQADLASSRRLLEACADDANCPLKFQNKSTVIDEVLAIYKKLDDDVGKSPCANYLASQAFYKKPSSMLRYLISLLAQDINKRDFLPLVFAKIKTCTQEDLDLIGPFIDPGVYGQAAQSDEAVSIGTKLAIKSAPKIIRRRLQTTTPATAPRVFDTVRSNSALLYNVIVYSELYGPLPSLDELKTIYNANPLSRPDAIVTELDESLMEYAGELTMTAQYCRSSGSQEAVCNAIQSIVPKGPAFVYKRDKYAEAPYKLTDTASALVLTGGLDFQTPAELGELLMTRFVGGRGNKLVKFDYGGHCRGEATANSMKMPCRNSIVKQFVTNDGDVTKIDTSCLKDQPMPVFPTTITN